MFDVLEKKKLSSALSLSKHEESSAGLPDQPLNGVILSSVLWGLRSSNQEFIQVMCLFDIGTNALEKFKS